MCLPDFLQHENYSVQGMWGRYLLSIPEYTPTAPYSLESGEGDGGHNVHMRAV